MIPKVEFIYSMMYDRRWKQAAPAFNIPLNDWPSPEKIGKFVKNAEEEWSKVDNKILKELSEVSNLKWKEKTIPCYMSPESLDVYVFLSMLH